MHDFGARHSMAGDPQSVEGVEGQAMTYRKVGGLHFIGIGPFGIVVYLSRRTVRNCMAGMHLWWLCSAQKWARMLVP